MICPLSVLFLISALCLALSLIQGSGRSPFPKPDALRIQDQGLSNLQAQHFGFHLKNGIQESQGWDVPTD
jgi:hypothetical protein